MGNKGMEIEMEYKVRIFGTILKAICLMTFIGLVIIGQKSVNYQGLITMMAGLCGILLLLYFYNRKYK